MVVYGVELTGAAEVLKLSNICGLVQALCRRGTVVRHTGRAWNWSVGRL